MSSRFLIIIVVLSMSQFSFAAPPERAIDFNRDIRPILSNNCFACHGPDEKARKADLRLDTEDGALATITRGKPEASELVRRVTSIETDERMPPAKTGKKLSSAEIELLTRWIRDGASFQKHWSYVAPKRPAIPMGRDQNPVDYFIAARLKMEGLKRSPEADRFTLARRVSLDLTGLPPSLEQAEAFANDKSADAYERYVDKLLAKPSYGEHAARLWLDLARYADSAGYADDPARTIWPYRDYVIKSFNANKLFDQFTIEQIAGDLLPNPTPEQLIATAFHRNTMTNNEGGTNDEEFRSVAVVDRVNTTMNVWMGTSMACAQCHNHKYDPISQKEYFQFYAFLNNTADADRTDESPLFSMFSAEQQKQRAAWNAELLAIEKRMNSPEAAVLAGQPKWESSFPSPPVWSVPKPTSAASGQALAVVIREGNSIFIGETLKGDSTIVELPLNLKQLSGLRIEALPDPKLPSQGPGHGSGNFVITSVTLSLVSPDSTKKIAIASAFADREQAGYEAATLLIDPKKKPNGWAPGKAGQTSRLTLLPKTPIEVPEGSKLIITIDHKSPQVNHTLGHFRIAISDSTGIAETASLPVVIAEALAADRRTDTQKAALRDYYVQNNAPEFRDDRKRKLALAKSIAVLQPDTVPVMKELLGAARRKTRIQLRGNFQDLGEEVSEGMPAALHPLPKDAPLNRLALARWLVATENPLTARVIANRYWEQFFGHGLVRTSEEFGAQGDPPSHPELLDWLATELIRLKWDTKAFVKMLVMSATYRQSSAVTKESLERDADNRYLSRGPRLRLTAEMVRDQALAAGGLLSTKLYGPSVRPPQPEAGLTAAFGKTIDWKTSEGEDRYRRGFYTTWRRSNPYPSMSTFDAPNRDICIVRRNPTNTPLQALVTLNDTVFIEAAQSLARLTVKEGGESNADKARYAFRRCLTRPARDEEVKVLVKLFEESQATYASDPKKANQMATVPLGPMPEGMNAADLAAWTVVGNVLLNLDETLMKR